MKNIFEESITTTRETKSKYGVALNIHERINLRQFILQGRLLFWNKYLSNEK